MLSFESPKTPITQELVLACDKMDTKLAESRDLCSQLTKWIAEQSIVTGSLIESLSKSPLADWDAIISNHEAAIHPWYDHLSMKASLCDFQHFLREEARMPPFVPILERVALQVRTHEAKKALSHNISDEKHPTPHAALFSQMVDEVCGTSIDLRKDSCELAATNLVFYHCLVGPISFALGALYATELMVPRRARCLLQCLQRLGFSAKAQDFMRIHAEVDEGHAADWMERVIVPELEANNCIKSDIAAGVAVRLITSKNYLDSLL